MGESYFGRDGDAKRILSLFVDSIDIMMLHDILSHRYIIYHIAVEDKRIHRDVNNNHTHTHTVIKTIYNNNNNNNNNNKEQDRIGGTETRNINSFYFYYFYSTTTRRQR